MQVDAYFKANREHWNEVTPIHEKSGFYDVQGFRAGKSSLTPIELEEIGDMEGKSLLHLQCDFGLDTLSWARLGAQVTGVDFSDKAIALAISLGDELDIEARFILSNVYDLAESLAEKFDIVFTSYGVLTWLPDLERWAQVIAHFLKPGGTFYMVELRPFATVFSDEEGVADLKVNHPYFHSSKPAKYEPDGTGTYADRSATVTTTTFELSHSLGDVLNSLISAGLRIELLHEFPYCIEQLLPLMERGKDGWWRLSERSDSIPLMFSIKAIKGSESG